MDSPGFFFDVLHIPLLTRALEAGALAGISCACLSPLVVLRRMAFVGDGMAHAAFGGLGLALFLLSSSRYEDISVQIGTLLFCLVVGLGIGKASRSGDSAKMAEDSAIGIAFSVSMALGALFIALRQRYYPAQYIPALDTYLFGNVLNISSIDIWILLGVTVTVVASLALFQKEILFYTFDARQAEISGLNVGLIHYLFIALLVLAVVVSSRVVGIILVSASLVLPGVTALKLCSRMYPAMLTAAVMGFTSFELGMYVAYDKSVPPGSAVILIQFAMLLLASLVKYLAKNKAAKAERAAA